MINNEISGKVIIWQKWADPFGQDHDDDDMDWSNFKKQDHTDDDEINEEAEEENYKPEIKQQFIQAIQTPMGIIPMNEHTASGKIFNFWLGHTNFNISESVMIDIENTDGVETLDVFTRYRFRIGIGKAFKDSVVIQNIQNKLYKT